jgi:hypothetical protein
MVNKERLLRQDSIAFLPKGVQELLVKSDWWKQLQRQTFATVYEVGLVFTVKSHFWDECHVAVGTFRCVVRVAFLQA